MANHKDLTVVHASLLVFSSDAEARADLEKIVKLRPHILTGTESGDRERKQIIRDVLTSAGYMVYTPSGTDGWIAVRSKLVGSGWNASYLEVIPSGRKSGDHHRHTAKGVVRVAFNHPNLGHIGVLTSHYLTLGRRPGQAQQDSPGDPINHRAENKRLAGALCDVAEIESKGSGIAIIGADTNMVDRTSDVFFGKPITTCWDERGMWPPTLQNSLTTMDVVATMDHDKRIKCIAATALDDREFRLHVDHFVVVTKYRVQKLTR